MEPSIKYVTLGGEGCPGKHYGALHGVGDVLAIVIKKVFFAHLPVDIKLTALIAMPVLGYIFPEFEACNLGEKYMYA